MKVVVLLSGGLDSTVLLAHCIRDGLDVVPITFDYGQQNRGQEIPAAVSVAAHYGLTTNIITLPPDVFGASALLGDHPIPTEHADQPDATVVPGRNLVFLAIAASIAARHDAVAVMIGANLDDDAGYIDCRPEFLQVLDIAVGLGTGSVTINAPFLSYSKTRIVGIGLTIDAPITKSWSCYTAANIPCGLCGACLIRAQATMEATG